MKMTELFLSQLDRETKSTRRTLEQVPDGKNDFKPHPKSMPMGYLSALVATIPNWIATMIEKNELDLATGQGRQEALSTNRELVELFDSSVASARRALENTTDDHLLTPWRLLVGGNVVDERPRHLIMADTLMHFAHHRGQLTVYLRLNDRKIPSIYGPTADESW